MQKLTTEQQLKQRISDLERDNAVQAMLLDLNDNESWKVLKTELNKKCENMKQLIFGIDINNWSENNEKVRNAILEIQVIQGILSVPRHSESIANDIRGKINELKSKLNDIVDKVRGAKRLVY